MPLFKKYSNKKPLMIAPAGDEDKELDIEQVDDDLNDIEDDEEEEGDLELQKLAEGGEVSSKHHNTIVDAIMDLRKQVSDKGVDDDGDYLEQNIKAREDQEELKDAGSLASRIMKNRKKI